MTLKLGQLVMVVGDLCKPTRAFPSMVGTIDAIGIGNHFISKGYGVVSAEGGAFVFPESNLKPLDGSDGQVYERFRKTIIKPVTDKVPA
ncbi:MAG: hypothetical protein ACM3SS_02710 [Rhodospirillaceae bacterium]